jgi:glycosyltransferase involved in cell wall biosynthesis
MKTLYFYVGHRDLVGGGQLALYHLAWALQDSFDVYLSSDFHPGMDGFEFMAPPRKPWKIGMPENVDVFLASSYTECPMPCGKVNLFYTFYPRMPAPPKSYDFIFTLSDFSRDAVFQNWGRESYKICGGVFTDNYKPILPKEKIVLNSSRFFIEGDANTFWGHSKNQHVLISAFKAGLERSTFPDWKLILAGSVLTQQDGEYLNACRRLAGDDPRIEFKPMLGKDALADLYGRADIFVSAMGYGRHDQAETEHYGLAVEKAVLSGCYSVVHDSGGAPEIATETWRTPEDLAEKILHVAQIFSGGAIPVDPKRARSLEMWRKEVAETFRAWA